MRILQVGLLGAALVAAPGPSRTLGAVPEKGEGTITVFGGLRTLLPSSGSYESEQSASHPAMQPGGLASFGYQLYDDLHFKIEIGYLVDRYRIAGGDLSVKTIPIMLAIDTVLASGPSYTLYGGAGIGYSLNSGTRLGRYNEANSTAASLALGFRLRIAEKLALVLEDRYTLARAAVDPYSPQQINVGGNLLSVGLLFHFLEPDEPNKPRAP